jgi:uncharacterized SAM-binding protein YcdF (DUF218 family)
MAATIPSKVVASNGTRRKPTKLFRKFIVLWLIRLSLTLLIFTAGVLTGRLYQKPFSVSFHFEVGGVK